MGSRFSLQKQEAMTDAEREEALQKQAHRPIEGLRAVGQRQRLLRSGAQLSWQSRL